MPRTCQSRDLGATGGELVLLFQIRFTEGNLKGALNVSCIFVVNKGFLASVHGLRGIKINNSKADVNSNQSTYAVTSSCEVRTLHAFLGFASSYEVRACMGA